MNATIGKEHKKKENMKSNKQDATWMSGVGWIGLILTVLIITSCATLTDAQLTHRNEIEREIGKVYTEYVFKTDSLIIEYHRK